jgi:ABC-2 type transport system permease protein
MKIHGLGAAVQVEGRKTLAARVPAITLILFVVGVTAICLSTTVAAATGSPEVLAKLGPLVVAGGWPGYLNAALQVAAAGSAGGCGILLSWSFGREFSEGTISGLFTLPVSRSVIASAKLIAYLLWSVAAAVLLTATVIIAGMFAGLGTMAPADAGVAGRLPLLVLMTAGVALPAAWVSTLGRSILGGIAVTIGLVASAQVLVFTGAGAWYPPAAPALWALQPTRSNALAALIGLALPLIFAMLTALTWRRLQLNR